MSSDSDDALAWDGDEDLAAQKPSLPDGWNAVGRGSEKVERAAAPADEKSDAAASVAVSDEPAGISSAMLLLLGVIGGVYLLYAIGWFVGGMRLQPLASFFVADAMFLPWFVLAVIAPALWFLATWVLTRGRAGWTRVVALLVGVVLLVPWPFVNLGAIGA